MTDSGLLFCALFFGSLIYYAALEPHFVLVLLTFTILNAALASPKSKVRAFAAVAADLALLIYCKYHMGMAGAALPIGISFYLFKMISFQLDLYRGTIKEKPHFFEITEYFVLFPQLVQGPIARYGQMYDPDVSSGLGRPLSFEAVEDGLMLLMTGVVMKILLADRLGLVWNQIRRIGYDGISTGLAWLGAADYSLWLYYDFWSYSLMAAGLAMMLGFPFIENFRHPYSASSVTDFYRRWHVTLGSFFKEYIYFPMGGSRKGTRTTFLNLLVVWAVTGFWHGITPNFMIWALMLFALIVWEKLLAANLLARFPFLGRLHVWILIPVSWVVFALPDRAELTQYLLRMFPFVSSAAPVNSSDVIKLLEGGWPQLALGILFCIPGLCGFLVKKKLSLLLKAVLLILFWVAVYMAVISQSNPFLYLNF